jgi:hypothetical protein
MDNGVGHRVGYDGRVANKDWHLNEYRHRHGKQWQKLSHVLERGLVPERDIPRYWKRLLNVDFMQEMGLVL